MPRVDVFNNVKVVSRAQDKDDRTIEEISHNGVLMHCVLVVVGLPGHDVKFETDDTALTAVVTQSFVAMGLAEDEYRRTGAAWMRRGRNSSQQGVESARGCKVVSNRPDLYRMCSPRVLRTELSIEF